MAGQVLPLGGAPGVLTAGLVVPIEVSSTVAADGRLRSLFDARYREMVRVAVALLGDRGAAEDAVQEAFARVDRVLHRLSDDDAVPYLRRAVVNECHSNWRRERTRKRTVVPLVERAARGIDDDIVAHDARRLVLIAVGALTPRQRECIVLRYFSGLSDREVAEATGLSIGAAKTHIRRAHHTLAKALEELR